MGVEIIRDIEGFYSIKNEWERLEKNNKNLSFYDTFEYNYNWFKNFENESKKKIFIITIYSKKDELTAIFPFCIKESINYGLKIRTLEFLSRGDYHNIIVDTSSMNINKIFNLFFRFIEESKELFDKVSLTHLNVKSDFGKYLLKHQKYNEYFKLLVETPILKKENNRELEEYKKKYLSKNVKNLNNRLLKDVDYKFEVTTDNCLEMISKIHIKQQKEEKRSGRTSLFENKNRINFFNKIYNDGEHLTFLIKDKNNEVISYQTAYAYNETLNFWNIGYKLMYKKYSIGRIGIWKMIEWFFENEKYQYLDFGSGRYPWKFQWTDDMVSVYKLEFYTNDSRDIQMYKKLKELKKGIRCFLNILKR